MAEMKTVLKSQRERRLQTKAEKSAVLLNEAEDHYAKALANCGQLMKAYNEEQIGLMFARDLRDKKKIAHNKAFDAWSKVVDEHRSGSVK